MWEELFLFLQFLIIGCGFTGAGVFLIILLIVDAAAVIFIIRKADGLDLIMDGLKKISDGELQYKIKTDTLTGKQKVMAEYINNIGSGLDAAVENSLKKERMQTELITNVSHDLKTPLTSVIGYLTLLHDEKEISPALQEKYLGVALEKAERLEDLINEFFDITRFNLTHLTLDVSRINLTRMLEQTLYEFAPMFAEKQLDTSVQVPADLYFLCDPDKLQRVLDNLLRNAVNYSFPESVIKIRLYVDMGILTLIVENEGSTIPPEKLERIFEQFFRLDSSRASRNGGAGLGLAIAKEIVELHGGKISAESHDNHVIFQVDLPYSSGNR